uniref:NADH-cytochrome b5 reductase n=1 Tax=Oryza meridionalis TaxID=40149 RepID=A0A0E0BXU8_9ORYZ
MAALLLRRLAGTHRGRVPLAAAAAVAGGAALFCASSPPTIALMEEKGEDAAAKVALNPDKWLEFKLQEKATVSHNSQLFRFSFDPSTKLGLDVASCLITRAPIGEEVEGGRKFVIRPYTPISDPDSKGYFDLLIKVYPDGKMSQYFASLKPGDVVEVKGPIEKLRYSPNMKKQIGMIAGGTGITPMLQVVRAILKNPDDNTQVSLIYANVSPDDILLKRELDRLASSYPNFKVFYTVDKPSNDWRGGVGYISKDIALKGLPRPGEDSLILVCGPPGMMNHISGDKAKDRSQGELTGILKELGYTADMPRFVAASSPTRPRPRRDTHLFFLAAAERGDGRRGRGASPAGPSCAAASRQDQIVFSF